MPDVRHDKLVQVAQGEMHGAGETHESVGVAHEEIKPPLAENSPWQYTIVGGIVALAVLGFGLFGMSKGISRRNPSRPQTLLEQGIASITFFCRSAIGEGGEKFAPLVGTVFAFVLISNLMGVLPTIFVQNPHAPIDPATGKHVAELRHLIPAPTANLSMTLAISFWVFLIVNYVGIKENGFGGWLKHFCGPIPLLAPLMFPIEFIGALVKPISLSIRLFGNVFGEETVIAVLTSLAVVTVGGWIPFQFPMLVFGVFGGLVQAAVFAILTCAYIALSIGDHDDHGHGAAHDDIKDEFGAHVPAH